MEQLGWLHSRNKNQGQTRNKIYGRERWNLPEIPMAGQPILGALLEIGLANNGGPITWGEIRAWQEVCKQPLSYGEAKLIKQLSEKYVASCRTNEGVTVPSPVQQKEAKANKGNVGSMLQQALRKLSD